MKEIATSHGAEPNGSFEIPANATMHDCIGYTLYHVCGQRPGGKRHYRYDRYGRALRDTLRRIEAPFDDLHRTEIPLDYIPGEPVPSVGTAGKNAHVVALDIGSGPGIFSWVAHDYFQPSEEVDLELFGLDRCPSMVDLARSLWQRMDTRIDLKVESDWKRIHSGLSMTLSSHQDSTVIVTIGHLLVQIVDDCGPINQVARYVADCVSLASMPGTRSRCFVIGADAFSHGRRQLFRRAWECLRVRLDKAHRISLSTTPLYLYSQVCGEATLTPEAGRGGT